MRHTRRPALRKVTPTQHAALDLLDDLYRLGSNCRGGRDLPGFSMECLGALTMPVETRARHAGATISHA